jgi:hypothetical protein
VRPCLKKEKESEKKREKVKVIERVQKNSMGHCWLCRSRGPRMVVPRSKKQFWLTASTETETLMLQSQELHSANNQKESESGFFPRASK